MDNTIDILTLTKKLVSNPSVTPADKGCQQYIAAFLQSIGFTITHLPFGEVDNLWAQHGQQRPLFVFLGHTDVVPAGNEENWHFPPFTPTEADGYLYGRGVADMKSNIAAMMIAVQRFLQRFPHYGGSIAFLLTSDEEGPAQDGTVRVVDYLQQQKIFMDWCLVGEPSSGEIVGDTLKIGRRGSLSFRLIIHGKQGHVAYPHLADNPLHRALPALLRLTEEKWDNGNAQFPPTSLQLSNVHGGTGALNVIPGKIIIDGNFRYSPEVTAVKLQQQVENILQQQQLTYDITWQHSAKPFYTTKNYLIDACLRAVEKQVGMTPQLSTSGGTSDGRFIAPLGVEVVELGLQNATIHQVNERVKIRDIEKLVDIYQQVLVNVFQVAV